MELTVEAVGKDELLNLEEIGDDKVSIRLNLLLLLWLCVILLSVVFFIFIFEWRVINANANICSLKHKLVVIAVTDG